MHSLPDSAWEPPMTVGLAACVPTFELILVIEDAHVTCYWQHAASSEGHRMTAAGRVKPRWSALVCAGTV